MVSKVALLSSLLLASAALAAPSSLVEASLARGREDRQPRPISHVMSRTDAPFGIRDPFAGVVLTWKPGSTNIFGYVSAVITVPVLNDHAGEVPTHAVAAIALGNYEQNRTIKLGIAFGSDERGAYYSGTIEEDDVPVVWLPHIPIRPGDHIEARIDGRIHPGTSVELYLHNLSLEPHSYPPVCAVHCMSTPLIQKDVAWIVQGYHQDRLPNFGDVSFEHIFFASATQGRHEHPHLLTYDIMDELGNNLTHSFRTEQTSFTIERLANV